MYTLSKVTKGSIVDGMLLIRLHHVLSGTGILLALAGLVVMGRRQWELDGIAGGGALGGGRGFGGRGKGHRGSGHHRGDQQDGAGQGYWGCLQEGVGCCSGK